MTTENNQTHDPMSATKERVQRLVNEMMKWPEMERRIVSIREDQLPHLAVKISDTKTFKCVGTVILSGKEFNSTISDEAVLKSVRTKLRAVLSQDAT